MHCLEPQKADEKAEGGLPFAGLERAQSVHQRPEGTFDRFANKESAQFYFELVFMCCLKKSSSGSTNYQLLTTVDGLSQSIVFDILLSKDRSQLES